MQESYTNLTYNCARIMCKCWGYRGARHRAAAPPRQRSSLVSGRSCRANEPRGWWRLVSRRTCPGRGDPQVRGSDCFAAKLDIEMEDDQAGQVAVRFAQATGLRLGHQSSEVGGAHDDLCVLLGQPGCGRLPLGPGVLRHIRESLLNRGVDVRRRRRRCCQRCRFRSRRGNNRLACSLPRINCGDCWNRFLGGQVQDPIEVLLDQRVLGHLCCCLVVAHAHAQGAVELVAVDNGLPIGVCVCMCV